MSTSNQSSAFIQTGFVNNFANRVPWTVPRSRERACFQARGEILAEGGSCGGSCGGPPPSILPVVSITDQLLNGISGRPFRNNISNPGWNTGKMNGREDYTYTPLQSEPEDLRILGLLQDDNQCTRRLARLRAIPSLAEPRPGIFEGRLINELLLPDQQPVRVSAEGEIFGGPETALIQRRIDQLNGFGEIANVYSYGMPGLPGSFDRPFIKDNFYISVGLGNSSLFANRIFQNATIPTGYTPPTGTVDTETQGLALYVNGQASRILRLVRGRTYYFHFPLLSCSNTCLPACVDPCLIDSIASFYFTLDPVGGNVNNYINSTGDFSVTPQPFPGTSFIYPGSTGWITIDNTFPDFLFYQSTMGPFQGGLVLILGAESGCCC